MSSSGFPFTGKELLDQIVADSKAQGTMLCQCGHQEKDHQSNMSRTAEWCEGGTPRGADVVVCGCREFLEVE